MAISMFESAMDALFRRDFNLAETVIEKTAKCISWRRKQCSPCKTSKPKTPST